MAEKTNTPDADAVQVVLCTCQERDSLRLAHALVDQAAVACVNIVPKITSVYLWDGEVREDKESLLIIKTTQERIALLKQIIDDTHSYDLPEILVLAIDDQNSSAEYLGWVRSMVGPSQ
jgi:periplasmic divalent cation tolerance protein